MPTSKASRTFAGAAVALALAATATACGGGSTDAGGSSGGGKTLTYWASNQGTSVNVDKQVLTPELKKFTARTGIKVNLEVVPWSDLLNRIMAAASSGQGPDVLNIGNSWSASLQATGALLPWNTANMAKIGGADRFNPAALASTGVSGRPPAAVPLYALSYGLYWNKAEFKKAGIAGPPTTWAQLVADGKKLTGDGHWGIALECGQYQENAHHAFAFGKQLGANFFTAAGKPDFDSPQAVRAVKQYVDLMATDKIASPGDAEYANNQSVTDFATGKAAMLLWQAAGTSLKLQGMKPDAFGVAPVPFQSANASGTGAVDTMAAGINMAVFKNSHNLDGAVKFVKFMTSTTEQRVINGRYGSISPVKDAAAAPIGATPELTTLKQALADHSAPLPQVADESQFETLVGTAMKNLFADAAAGKAVTDATVKAELTKAQQQMPAS